MCVCPYHSQTTMFSCHKCGRMCKSKRGLTLHQKKCFSSDEVKPCETTTTSFVCTQCNKVCKSKGGLTLHQKKCSSFSSPVKTEVFTCDTCDKHYKTKRGLTNHIAKCKQHLSQTKTNDAQAITVSKRTAPKTNTSTKQTSTLLKEAYKMYNKDVFDNLLPNVPIRLLHQMYTKAGITTTTYFISETNEIDTDTIRSTIFISIPCHFKNPTALLNTLLHEMCHVAAVHLNNSLSSGEDCHGPIWQKWTKKAYEIHPELGELTVTVNLSIMNWAYYYQCGCAEQLGCQKRKPKSARCKKCSKPYSLVK